MSESVLTNQSLQDSYSSRCGQWRAGPVESRRCNDGICLGLLLVMIASFIAFGLYQGVHLKHVEDDSPVSTIDDIDGTQHQAPLSAAILSSIGLSFVYIILVCAAPKIVTYVMMGLAALVLLFLAILSFLDGAPETGGFVVFLFIAYLGGVFCYRQKILVGFVLINAATKFIRESKAVFLAPLAKLCFSIIFAMFWATVFIIISLRTKHPEDFNEVREHGWMFLWFMYLFYFCMTLYYATVFSIASVCAHWYYSLKDDSGLCRSYKWMLCSSLGSIFYAAFLSPIVIILGLTCDLLRTSDVTARGARCVVHILNSVTAGFEDMFAVLNHNAIIVMSVTGESFVAAGRSSLGVLSDNFQMLESCNVISKILMFLGVCISSGSGTMIGEWYAKDFKADLMTRQQLTGMMLFSSAFFSTLVLSILTESVASVFVFYCFEDRYKQLGYPPLHMPQDIRNLLRTRLEYQESELSEK